KRQRSSAILATTFAIVVILAALAGSHRGPKGELPLFFNTPEPTAPTSQVAAPVSTTPTTTSTTVESTTPATKPRDSFNSCINDRVREIVSEVTKEQFGVDRYACLAPW